MAGAKLRLIMSEQTPMQRVRNDRASQFVPLTISVATVIVSIMASIATASFMAGRQDERLSQMVKSVDSLSVASSTLALATTALRVQTESLKDALEHERQDRLDAEHRRLIERQ